MTDIDKQTLAKCVRIAYESSTPEGTDIAWELAEAYGYTVEELLKPEPPKAPKWYENIPEQGVLCWLNGIVYELHRGHITSEMRYLKFGLTPSPLTELTPLTNEEIESFKRGPKSNTEYMKGYAAGQASRDEMIKKLVADNADLTQKHLELVADMQLLGERPTSGYMQYTERHAGYELVYECWIRKDYVIARFNTRNDAEYYCQLYNSAAGENK